MLHSKAFLIVLLASFLSGCMGGCATISDVFRSPKDLPSKVEIAISPDTGNEMFLDPTPNSVIADVRERELNAYKDYKLDRIEILDGDALIASTVLMKAYSGRVRFEGVRFTGPAGRVGKLYARVCASMDRKYCLNSPSWQFTVKLPSTTLFHIEDLGANIGIQLDNPPDTASLIHITFGGTEYGDYLVTDLIILPKPKDPSIIIFEWFNDEGEYITTTQDTIK